MDKFLSIIYEDHELLDKNYYLEREYNLEIKHNKIKKILNLVNVHNIKYVNLENAKLETNQLHFYIFYKPSVYKFGPNQEIFSDKLLNALKENENIKVLYFMAEEVIDEENLIDINDYFDKRNINGNRIVLYTNSSNLDFYIKKHNFKIQNIKTSGLLIGFVKNFKKIEIDFIEEKKFLYLTQNSRFKKFRFLLLSFLYEKNLLDNTDWSMLENPFYLNDRIDYNEYTILTKNKEEEINKFIAHIYNMKYKRNFHELNENFKNFNSPFLIKETFLDSYINITTETHFTEDTIHITEKSYKPFYFCQLPIIIGSCGHIKKMKELYNYDFFDDLINHDYDDETNHEIRLSKIFDEIERLSKNENIIKEFYKNNKVRFEKNKKITEDLEYIDESIYFYNLK